MPSLKKDTYIKKYIGAINTKRTENYKKDKKVDTDKYKLQATNYTSIKKIINKKFNDVTGYLSNGKIHYTKTKADKSRKSKKEPWERK